MCITPQLLALALCGENFWVSFVNMSRDMHGQPLEGSTLLPEKLILEKGACGLVRPVHEIPRLSDLNVLILLAASVETVIGMMFAPLRADLLFIIKVHTA